MLTLGFGIRRPNPTIVGTFDWLAAKHYERLHRYRSASPIDRVRRLVRPLANRIMMVLDGR